MKLQVSHEVVTSGFEPNAVAQKGRQVGLRSNGDLAVPLWIPQSLVPLGALLLLLAAIAAFVAACRGEASPVRDTPAAGIE